MGDQKVAETLLYSELLGKSSRVARADWAGYIETAQVFQDVPFSTSRFLPWLVTRYPDALFIHVSRDADTWYRSLVSHHITRRLGIDPLYSSDGSLVWTRELEMASVRKPYRGHPLHELIRVRFGSPAHDPYRKSILVTQHLFQQDQARLLLADRDALLFRLTDLNLPRTAREISSRLNLDGPSMLPHKNRGVR